MSLAVSTGVLLLVCLLAHLLRLVVRRTVSGTELNALLQEGIAASELCACAFELGISKYQCFPFIEISRKAYSKKWD